MRLFVPRTLPLVFDNCVGGGFKRDGSNNDGTLACFFTGVRFGDDFRLPAYVFKVFAL